MDELLKKFGVSVEVDGDGNLMIKLPSHVVIMVEPAVTTIGVPRK